MNWNKQAIALAIGYLIAAGLTVSLTRFGGGVAFVWIASAILTSYLALTPKRAWAPAMIGCAVLTGPNIQNFRDAYQHLVRKGGARVVKDVEMLAKAVHYLMITDNARRKMVEAGQDAMEDMRGALSKTVKALEPYINPLTVTARLQPKVATAASSR